MEILRKGKIEGDKTADFMCLGCHSELRAKKSEARRIMSDRDGTAAVFDCPVCKREIWVNVGLFK